MINLISIQKFNGGVLSFIVFIFLSVCSLQAFAGGADAGGSGDSGSNSGINCEKLRFSNLVVPTSPLSGTVRLVSTSAISSDFVSSGDILLDGNVVLTGVLSQNPSFFSQLDVDWNTFGVPNGNHILTARFITACGLEESAPVEVIVQNVPRYSCVGFQAPFEQPIAVKKSSKKVLPLKIELRDANGVALTDSSAELAAAAPTVKVELIGPATGTALGTKHLLNKKRAFTGNEFVFDPRTSTWRFNLGLLGYTALGQYKVTVESSDSTVYLIDPTCTQVFERRKHVEDVDDQEDDDDFGEHHHDD